MNDTTRPDRVGGAKQCPFCAYAVQIMTTRDTGRHKERVVMCLNCGAFGPSGVSKNDAIKMWNLRREEFPRAYEPAPVSADTDSEEDA